MGEVPPYDLTSEKVQTPGPSDLSGCSSFHHTLHRRSPQFVLQDVPGVFQRACYKAVPPRLWSFGALY